jgi:transposase-like protein
MWYNGSNNHKKGGLTMAANEAMTMMEFMDRYGDEEACRDYLYKTKWPEGFVCPKCKVKDEPFNIVSRNRYQCRHCTHQTSVTAGTVMDKTQTPLRKWFLAIYLMSADKRGCSALRLKRELSIAYDTAWTMTHKIRNAMKQRDGMYQLQGIVELDDAFFGSPSEGGKRGRGTEKTPVVIGLSLGKNGKPEYVRAQVIKAVDGKELIGFAEANIGKGSEIRSDGLPSYNKLADSGYDLLNKSFDPKSNPEHLRWLHIVVSNIKAFFLGTYHGIGRGYMQAFLDEFCFRFNRRKWQGQLFSRTLAACSYAKPFTRNMLVMQ